MGRPPRACCPRSSPTSEVQVPRPTKDLPFQEVRLHQVRPTRLRGGHQDRRHRSRRCHLPVPPQPRPSLQVEETDGLISIFCRKLNILKINMVFKILSALKSRSHKAKSLKANYFLLFSSCNILSLVCPWSV